MLYAVHVANGDNPAKVKFEQEDANTLPGMSKEEAVGSISC